MVMQLTYKEAKLLEMFFRHRDKLIEREMFLKTVWEEDGFFVAEVWMFLFPGFVNICNKIQTLK